MSAFEEAADKALGLAVSIFTLCSEDQTEHTDSTLIARELVAELGHDARYAGQALAFLGKLLARHMTPEQVRAEKEALMERVIGRTDA